MSMIEKECTLKDIFILCPWQLMNPAASSKFVYVSLRVFGLRSLYPLTAQTILIALGETVS